MEFPLEFSKDCHRLQDYDCYRVLLHFDIMNQAKQPQARQNMVANPVNSLHENSLDFGFTFTICSELDFICKNASIGLTK